MAGTSGGKLANLSFLIQMLVPMLLFGLRPYSYSLWHHESRYSAINKICFVGRIPGISFIWSYWHWTFNLHCHYTMYNIVASSNYLCFFNFFFHNLFHSELQHNNSVWTINKINVTTCSSSHTHANSDTIWFWYHLCMVRRKFVDWQNKKFAKSVFLSQKLVYAWLAQTRMTNVHVCSI